MKLVRLLLLSVGFWALQACVTATNSGSSPPSDEEAARANMNLGAGYLRQGRPDLAIERLTRALDQNPRLADAHSIIALAYEQQGIAEQAEEHYRRATQLEPNNPAAANAYATFLCRTNRFDQAEPLFRRAANNPVYNTPEVALTNAGLCARSAGNNAKAEEYFRAALNEQPRFADALRNMMDLSYQSENYMQTRAFVQRYLEAQPASPDVLLMCYNVEQRLNNRLAADRCAERLRSGFPTSAEFAQLQDAQQANGGR
jgi:type IV pilus assembly protein PilF